MLGALAFTHLLMPVDLTLVEYQYFYAYGVLEDCTDLLYNEYHDAESHYAQVLLS